MAGFSIPTLGIHLGPVFPDLVSSRVIYGSLKFKDVLMIICPGL